MEPRVHPTDVQRTASTRAGTTDHPEDSGVEHTGPEVWLKKPQTPLCTNRFR